MTNEPSSFRTESATPSWPERLRRLLSGTYSREITLAVLIILLVAAYFARHPRNFPPVRSPATFFNNLAADGVLAIGMMTLMIGGLFDLSIGSLFALGGVLAALFATHPSFHWPLPIAMLAGLLAVMLCGLANGFIVAKIKVNPLITTLATMGVFSGVAFLIGGTATPLPDTVRLWPQKNYWGLYLFAAAALVLHYLLAHTRFFRQYYYIGSNAKAAELSGIAVERMQMLAYTVMAGLAALAGIADAIRNESASATIGAGAELKAITAVVLGGASLAGGKGTIAGAILGVLFMALIGSIMTIERIDPNWQKIIVSSALVAIVAIDALVNRRTR
jgi:ribose/xylose/arabinose/galactoside ABC-type transport system permease subunit